MERKKITKKLALFLVMVQCSVLIFGSAMTTMAATTKTPTMYAKTTVSARVGASTSKAVKYVLKLNNAVSKLGKTGAWTKISYKGVVAYVPSSTLSSSAAPTMYAKTTVSARAKNASNGAVKYVLKLNNAVLKLGTVGAWTKISYKGVVAYVPSSTLSSSKITMSKTLNVNCILQNPELPTGCEVTSLTILLNYLGVKANKCTIADKYLSKGGIGVTTPWEGFVGNPRSSSSYGCYAPVIAETALKYLTAVGSKLRPHNISGATPDTLYKYIDAGKPVIVWATTDMVPSYLSATWYVRGKTIRWRSREHCLVLIGYDKTKNTVTLADPLKGNTVYNKTTFETRYTELYKQAVVIY